MTILRLFAFVCVAISASVLRADFVLLSDNFTGPSLDTAKWQTILPFGQSSIVQGGGTATTTGRGILATVQEFSGPYVVSGSFKMNSELESFVLAFRTNLSPLPDPDLFNTLSGMFITFSNDANQVNIEGRGYSPQFSTPNSHGSYPLNAGQTYTFSLFDDGANIALAINGVQAFSATTTVATGGHVAFYSREFPFTSTSIDEVTITAVPDSIGTFALLAVGLLGLGVVQRLNGGRFGLTASD